MVIFIVLTLAPLAGGTLSGIRLVRAIRCAQPLRVLHIMREAIVCANCLLGTALFILMLLPRSPIAPYLLLLLVAGLMLAGLMRVWTRGVHENNSNSLREYLMAASTRWASRGVRFFRNLGRRIAPEGWTHDLNWSFSVFEALMTTRTMARTYVAILFIAPLIFAPMTVLTLNNYETMQREVLSAVIGFNAILVASCLTAAVLVAIFVATLLRWIGFIRFEFAYLHVVRRLAGSIGYGTGMGALTAALVPLVLALPSGGRTYGIEAMSPALLIELPAFGAVVGYFIGIIYSVVGLGRNATNVVYRRLLVPALCGLIVSCFLSLGLSPRGIFERIAHHSGNRGMASVDICEVTDADSLMGDTPSLLMFLHHCEDSPILSGEAFAWIAISVSVLAVVLALIADVRPRRGGSGHHVNAG